MTNFNEPHFCYDWDFMLVVPGSIAMYSCMCDSLGIRIRKGDKVKTDFNKHESDKIRIVKSCYKEMSHCQSGWFIETDDGLKLDSAWFTEV